MSCGLLRPARRAVQAAARRPLLGFTSRADRLDDDWWTRPHPHPPPSLAPRACAASMPTSASAPTASANSRSLYRPGERVRRSGGGRIELLDRAGKSVASPLPQDHPEDLAWGSQMESRSCPLR